MKKLILLTLTLLLSFSCKDITGNMEVFETITLVKKGKGTVIEPGTYESKLKFKSKKKIKLKVAGKNFTFRIPKGTPLPKKNGELRLTAEQVKQAYDLNGAVKTVRNRTETRESYETCRWSVPYTMCSSGQYGHRYCSTYYHYYYGQRFVRYHNLIVDKAFTFKLLTPATEDVVAEFKGKDVKVHRIYEYHGACH